MTILPSACLWLLWDRMAQTRNILVYGLVTPIFLALILGGIYFLLSGLGDMLSKFSLDQALDTAQLIQKDLQRSEQYGANYFNIGAFDGSVGSALRLAPAAIFAGLYRPQLYEAGNIVMLVSGLENFLLLGLTVLIVIKRGLRGSYRIIKTNSYLKFSLFFCIFFAFMIGLTTANFGALVRFKIPIYPFYLSTMLIIFYYPRIALIQSKRELDAAKKALDQE